ncbi:hypothetical protein [Catellatospora vulcania]|uniref:hypothetical protein n=1 Tax=Catellatospora vulcania TaxID=1460450 RepID=UPI0012D4B2F4|nr:hypothetical protein [Catellatospora vulcania]
MTHTRGGVVAAARAALLDETREFNSALNELLEKHIPSCPYADDLAFISQQPAHRREPLTNLFRHVSLAGHSITMNIADHLRALTNLLNADELPVTAHWPLVRGALEGAARLRHLLDERADSATRLLRGAAMLTHSADEKLVLMDDVIQQLPVQAGRKAALQFQQDLANLLKQSGIRPVVNPNNGRVSGLKWGENGKVTTTGPNVMQLINERFTNHPAVYRFTSAPTHSVAWSLRDDALMSADGSRMAWRPDAMSLGSAATTALTAWEAVLAGYAWYHGHAEIPATQATRDRRQQVEKAMKRLVDNALTVPDGRGGPASRSPRTS